MKLDDEQTVEERIANRRGEGEHAVTKALRAEVESLRRVNTAYLEELERERVQCHQRVERMETVVAKMDVELKAANVRVEKLNKPSVSLDAFGLAVLAVNLQRKV